MCCMSVRIPIPCATGIGPWKLAMLSACLFLWDVMWKQNKPCHAGEWKIAVDHLERAYKLLTKIFHKIRLAPHAVMFAVRLDHVACTSYTPSRSCRWYCCNSHIITGASCIHTHAPCEGAVRPGCITRSLRKADGVLRGDSRPAGI